MQPNVTGPLPNNHETTAHAALVNCWANVVDGGPTVNQCCDNVKCLLGTPEIQLSDNEALNGCID